MVSLPLQLPFVVSIGKNMERTLTFQQSRYLLKTQFRRIMKVHFHGLLFIPKIHNDQAFCLLVRNRFLSSLSSLTPPSSWFDNILPKANSLPNSVLRVRYTCCVPSTWCQKQESLRVSLPTHHKVKSGVLKQNCRIIRLYSKPK